MWAQGQVHPTQCRLFLGDELTWQGPTAVGVWNNRALHFRGTCERCCSLYFVFWLIKYLSVCTVKNLSMFDMIHQLKAALKEWQLGLSASLLLFSLMFSYKLLILVSVDVKLVKQNHI